MTKQLNTQKEFRLNSSDLSRISSDQQDLKKYNKLNNSDISLGIISNSYKDKFFIMKDGEHKDKIFSLLPEITLYENKIFLNLFNLKDNTKIEIYYTKDHIFEK